MTEENFGLGPNLVLNKKVWMVQYSYITAQTNEENSVRNYHRRYLTAHFLISSLKTISVCHGCGILPSTGLSSQGSYNSLAQESEELLTSLGN